VLRDRARLGLKLSHGGMWAGRSVVPASWIAASTTAGPDAPSPTYGYQVWISHLDRRRFYCSACAARW